MWTLGINEKLRIEKLETTGLMRRRLFDLGFVEGADVTKILSGRKISAFSVNGSVIALRKDDANKIFMA